MIGVKILRKLKAVIADDRFFFLTLILFILQAAWVAFSLNHSGYYDEQFHYGLSQFYSQYLNPWRVEQSANWDIWGDVVRHPSYLYYFILGKILNFLNLFSLGYIDKLIYLRLISVTFFAAGLYVYRKVLISLGFSKLITNLTLLFLIQIPVLTLIAGQVNYDNPMFFFAALFLLQGIKLIQRNELNMSSLVLFILTGVAGSMIKYAFLPLFFVGLLGVAVHYVLTYKKRLLNRAVKSFVLMSKVNRLVVLLLVIITSIVFLERYAVNYFHYKAFWPECHNVLSEERCSNYYIWNRNNRLTVNEHKEVDTSIIRYLGTWSGGMIETQYSVPYMTSLTNEKLNATIKPPLPLYYEANQAILLLGAIVLLLTLARTLRSRERVYIFSVAVFFTLVLIAVNYIDYRKLGVVAATNGRYLFPVLPVFIAFAAEGVSLIIRNHTKVTLLLLLGVLFTISQGGGIISTLMQAEQEWYWQKSEVLSLNTKLKGVVNGFVIKGE